MLVCDNNVHGGCCCSLTASSLFNVLLQIRCFNLWRFRQKKKRAIQKVTPALLHPQRLVTVAHLFFLSLSLCLSVCILSRTLSENVCYTLPVAVAIGLTKGLTFSLNKANRFIAQKKKARHSIGDSGVASSTTPCNCGVNLQQALAAQRAELEAKHRQDKAKALRECEHKVKGIAIFLSLWK